MTIREGVRETVGVRLAWADAQGFSFCDPACCRDYLERRYGRRALDFSVVVHEAEQELGFGRGSREFVNVK